MKTISTKIVKGLFTAAFAFVATTAFAQEEESKKLSISGSVDTYYRTILNSSDVTVQNSDFAVSSFANQTGFALGMANIIASYEGAKTGVVADLTFGPRSVEAVGADVPNVNQLYAYWNVSDAVTLTAGRFNTFLGYEVISPTGNFNYSTSYLFANGPFSHVGLKADFALSDDFSLMLAFMNPTDVNNNLTGEYALGAQLGYSGQFLNFYYDNKTSLGFEVDYTGGFDVSEDFFLGINAAYQDNDGAGFYGAALYPQLATSESFSLGLRAELFGFHAENVDDIPSVFAATLTGSYTVENLTIKPEIRLDSWSNDLEPFLDNDLEASKSLSSFLIAAIYSF